MGKRIELSVKDNKYLIDGELIINEPGYDTIVFAHVRIYENEKLLEDCGSNFVGMEFTPDMVAQELIYNYINGGVNSVKGNVNDNEEISLLREKYSKIQVSVSIFDNVSLTTKTITRNKKYLGRDGELNLEMIDDDGCAYYSNGDEYVLLREDMSIATDMEVFYGNTLYDRVTNNRYVYLDRKVINPNDYIENGG